MHEKTEFFVVTMLTMRTLRCVCPNMCYPEVIVADAISVVDIIKRTRCKGGVYTWYSGKYAITSIRTGNDTFYIYLGPYYHVDINSLDVDMYLMLLYLVGCRIVTGECTWMDAVILSDNMIQFNGVQVKPHRPFVVDPGARVWSGDNKGTIDKCTFVALSAALDGGIVY